jgi:hypothetical protein
MEVGINVEGGIFGKKTSKYITLINEEWRVEKSKKSINVEDGFLLCGGWNFSKSVSVGSTFITEMRVTYMFYKLPLQLQTIEGTL